MSYFNKICTTCSENLAQILATIAEIQKFFKGTVLYWCILYTVRSLH